MKVLISNTDSKSIVFEKIRKELESNNFTIVQEDQSRPWGGFFVIDENQTTSFASTFFSHLKLEEIQTTNKLVLKY